MPVKGVACTEGIDQEEPKRIPIHPAMRRGATKWKARAEVAACRLESCLYLCTYRRSEAPGREAGKLRVARCPKRQTRTVCEVQP